MKNAEDKAKKFSVQCRKCTRWEDMDRCRVCKTCAREANVDIEKEGVNEGTVAPFVVCPSCAIDDHIEKWHTVIKYRSFKNALLSGEAHKLVNGLFDSFETACAEARQKLEEYRETVFEELARGAKELSVRKFEKLTDSCDTAITAILQDSLQGEAKYGLEEFAGYVEICLEDFKEALADDGENGDEDEDESVDEEAEVGSVDISDSDFDIDTDTPWSSDVETSNKSNNNMLKGGEKQAKRAGETEKVPKMYSVSVLAGNGRSDDVDTNVNTNANKLKVPVAAITAQLASYLGIVQKLEVLDLDRANVRKENRNRRKKVKKQKNGARSNKY